jgi:hypothetical protein
LASGTSLSSCKLLGLENLQSPRVVLQLACYDRRRGGPPYRIYGQPSAGHDRAPFSRGLDTGPSIMQFAGAESYRVRTRAPDHGGDNSRLAPAQELNLMQLKTYSRTSVDRAFVRYIHHWLGQNAAAQPVMDRELN